MVRGKAIIHTKDGRGIYRIEGFSEIIQLCTRLDKAKAEYEVEWDAFPRVLIKYAVPAPERKRTAIRARVIRAKTCPKPQVPTLEKCAKELSEVRASLRSIIDSRKNRLKNNERTHASIETGKAWVRAKHLQKEFGTWLAKHQDLWTITREHYAELDAILGRRIKRESELGAHWGRKQYTSYVMSEARYIKNSVPDHWDFAKWQGNHCDAGHIEHLLSERAYWLEMRTHLRS